MYKSETRSEKRETRNKKRDDFDTDLDADRIFKFSNLQIRNDFDTDTDERIT